MSDLAVIVDLEALAQTALAATVAGLAVTFTFSTAIWGLIRAAELRRDGRVAAALSVGAVGALALLATLVAIVLGLVVMIRG